MTKKTKNSQVVGVWLGVGSLTFLGALSFTWVCSRKRQQAEIYL